MTIGRMTVDRRRAPVQSSFINLRSSILVSFALVAIASTASAQNLLVNGNFNANVASWTVLAQGTGTAVYSGLDANGSNTSGSLQMTNNTVPAARNYFLIQCHAASPGVSYDYGAKARVAAGQQSGIYSILVNFFTAPGCLDGGGSDAGNSSRLDFTPSGAWQGLSRTGMVAPAGTASVSVILGNHKVEAGGTTVCNFDDVFLAVTNTLRSVVTIPVAASIHGANGTFFHSDAWILNRSFTNSNVVTAVYHCFGGVGCGTPKTITLAPRETKLIQDIVATLFGVPESGGAIELFWDAFNGPITAQTRLFTPSSPPSYGFGVPALPSSAAATRVVFVGVAGNPDLTTGFRSNGGAYNPNAFPVTVTFTLADGATGAPLGNPLTRVWAPFEAAQVSNLTASLGAGAVVTTNAVLVATAVGGPAFFYVATVDNVSGDSIYVTASPDEPPVP